MNIYINILILVIFCYLLGSIQSGILLGKIFYKLDIRKFGSKSTGATNVNRVLGVKPGIIVLIMDILKGFIPILIIKLLFDDNLLGILGSCSIVIGHCFPIFHKFRGGKGVAAGFGCVIIHIPAIALILIISLPIIVFTKFVSLGAIVGAFLSIVLIFSLVIISYLEYEYLILGFIIPTIIIFKHYPNFIRLINKTENKISFNNASK
ncbi:MAG: glycerol-3-phosphate 1-O-acyltransferase PlsY [Dehalococcoidia bacterium]|nr:glycerol-3-phosphate 1-O-acyltransferase PlsY [Dehalococcoidia bacterium]